MHDDESHEDMSMGVVGDVMVGVVAEAEVVDVLGDEME